jgi:outer membrane protein assembly factor BamB
MGIRMRLIHALISGLLTMAMPAWCADSSKITVTGTPHRFICADSDRRLVALVAADGAIEWSHPISDEVHEAVVLPNGHVLYAPISGRISEFDTKSNQEVWSYDAPKMNGNAGKAVQVHDFERLIDGSTWIFESGSCRVIHIDMAGALLAQVPLTVDHPDAHRDTRNARRLDNGHFLVAHEGDNKVREYDEKGAVVWSYDVKSKVYGVLRLTNGNTLMATGDGHRLLEVDKTGAEVWSIGQHELPGITLAWLTQIERLPNGNTIVVNCHAGPDNPQIIEVTRDKKVVWSFRDFEHFGNAMAVASILDAPAGTIR